MLVSRESQKPRKGRQPQHEYPGCEAQVPQKPSSRGPIPHQNSRNTKNNAAFMRTFSKSSREELCLLVQMNIYILGGFSCGFSSSEVQNAPTTSREKSKRLDPTSVQLLPVPDLPCLFGGRSKENHQEKNVLETKKLISGVAPANQTKERAQTKSS